MPGPLYKHDCDECEHLGTFAPSIKHRAQDLYHCRILGTEQGEVVVVRWGDRPQDYRSLTVSSLVSIPDEQRLPEYTEALRRIGRIQGTHGALVPESIADDPDVQALVRAAKGLADTSARQRRELLAAVRELRGLASSRALVSTENNDHAYWQGISEGLAMAERLITAGDDSQGDNDNG